MSAALSLYKYRISACSVARYWRLTESTDRSRGLREREPDAWLFDLVNAIGAVPTPSPPRAARAIRGRRACCASRALDDVNARRVARFDDRPTAAIHVKHHRRGIPRIN